MQTYIFYLKFNDIIISCSTLSQLECHALDLALAVLCGTSYVKESRASRMYP